MKKIVMGEVIEINSEFLIVKTNYENFKCLKKNISDYHCNLERMFTLNRKYKFSIFINNENEKYISYKSGRPKLLKNKNVPVPTISGFRNLSNDMHKHLKEYKINKSNDFNN